MFPQGLSVASYACFPVIRVQYVLDGIVSQAGCVPLRHD